MIWKRYNFVSIFAIEMFMRNYTFTAILNGKASHGKGPNTTFHPTCDVISDYITFRKLFWKFIRSSIEYSVFFLIENGPCRYADSTKADFPPQQAGYIANSAQRAGQQAREHWWWYSVPKHFSELVTVSPGPSNGVYDSRNA